MIEKVRRFFCKKLYAQIDQLTTENNKLKTELEDTKQRSQEVINKTNKYYKGILKKNSIRAKSL